MLDSGVVPGCEKSLAMPPYSTAASLVRLFSSNSRLELGQQPDHGEHHKSGALVDGRMLEMTVGGDGLKHFGVDSPAAAAELMNEQRRYQAKLEIGGVEIGAFSLHRHFTFGLVIGSLS